ncbi:MAG: hypothetical protein RL065_486 [Bacteroidota bacterium]|jgi:hypothetical protein
MELTIEVKDSKADFVKELLSNFKYVKVKAAKKTAKEKFLEELKEAVHEVNLAKQGKIKLKSLDELLNEL